LGSQAKGEHPRPAEGSAVDPEASAGARRAEVRDLIAEARALRRIDYDRVLACADRAFELACQVDSNGRQDAQGMAEALSMLAHRSVILGDNGAALSQAGQALALVDARTPTVVLGELYDTTGWAHFCIGDYAESFALLLRALEIAEAVEDRSLQAYVMDSLANVQSSIGHPEEALEMQTSALTIHRELHDLIGEATTLNNMAYTKMDLGDIQGALTSAEVAADYAEQAERPILLVAALDTLCDVHMALGELAEAEGFARRGLELAVQNGWKADETNCLIGLARVAFARDHLHDARSLAQLALALAEQDRRNVEQGKCHKLLSEVLERQVDFADALMHFKRFHDIEQARLSDETQNRLATLRVDHQLETARKDAEIHRLRSLALEREVEEGRIVQEELEAQASLDPLTGLFNRGHMPVIAHELESGLANNRPASVIVLDVDDFKCINDTFGHRTGDRVLVSVAHEMTASVRDADVTCRWGGDEFLVFLGDTGPGDALATAERIRSAIWSCSNEQDDMCVLVTASIGVASATPKEAVSLEALIERADQALYTAKDSGRNRVVAHSA
jgi:diguanylate cyclase (GGDEF)-like protein